MRDQLDLAGWLIVPQQFNHDFKAIIHTAENAHSGSSEWDGVLCSRLKEQQSLPFMSVLIKWFNAAELAGCHQVTELDHHVQVGLRLSSPFIWL